VKVHSRALRYAVRPQGRIGSRLPIVLAVLMSLSMLTLDSCKKPPGKPTPVDTSHVEKDTSKGFLEQKYDSLSHTFTSFFKSLLPPGKDTTKGEIIVSSPPPDINSPTVTSQTPGEPGFLSTPVKRKVDFDTTGNVTEHESYLGSDVRTPTSTPLGDYLKAEEDAKIMEGYRAELHKQNDTGKNVETTTGILGDYNTIQIPIPPSIVPTIFGRPSINLKVNGDVAIHLAYRDQQTYATAGANFYGSETGLNFKQEINVAINGTIGDKLKIGTDWGSDRMFQYDNLLKFNYIGYPDEILQEFDAGNITFNTPSQYIGTQNDLFGLKAIMRFGPLYVTAVAAQKKGERNSKSFGGGAGTATEHQIKPWEYRRNRFWLDTSFIQFYEPYSAHIPRNVAAVTGTGKEYIGPGTKVEVWVQQSTNQTDINRRKAIAYYSLQGIPIGGTYTPAVQWQAGPANPGDSVVTAYWDLLDSNRYSVDPYTGILILNQEPEDNYTAVAVSYQTQVGSGADALQYGERSSVTDSTLVLKLLKPKQTFQTPSAPWWNNVVKNTYYIGGVNFDPSNFSTRIYVQKPGGHQDEYMLSANGNAPLKAISVLGLDRYNNNQPSNESPDGLTDFSTMFTSDDFVIDKKTGTIVFPYIQPFGNRVNSFNEQQHKLDPVNYKRDSTFYVPEIYNTAQDHLRQVETRLVMIDVKFTGGVSSTLNLNAFNLVDGSVRVTIGGTPLTEGQDFRVDYNSGTVTILNTDLLNTGAINVEYDVHDIFTNATKNILALRAEVPILDHGVIGTTLMNYSMSLPTLKTRQGEEPMSNWVWGVDGSYKFETPWITDALNALPVFNLKDKSELSVRADAALSIPNPNTDKSPMPVDNGASIAYLDDFEGGLNEFPLYMNYGRWVPASQPADSAFVAEHPTPVDTFYWKNAINKLKMKTWWQPPSQLPAITDIKCEQTATTGEPAQVMDIGFDPSQPGIYNPYPSALNTRDEWGGTMQYSPGLNVAATNTDAIQMWVQIQGIDNSDLDVANLRFDIGRISSDIIPNRMLNTEDKLQNGVYEPGEDIGLDGMATSDEQKFFSTTGGGGAAPWNPADPSNDDYSATNPPDSINGQEGNEQDAYSGLKPDSEDLEGTGSVNLDDAYYEYEIPLDLPNNKYVIGQGCNVKTWYQLRIPLADFKRIVGTQDSTFSNISYYRFWLTGIQKPVTVRFYDVELVGSQWTRGLIGLNPTSPVTDTSLRVGYVNIEENGAPPTSYYKPDGAAQQTVPASTTYILGNEQSLNMQLACVGDTGRREVQRVFPTPNDLFNYREMAIWAHGDTTNTSAVPSAPINKLSDTINRIWIYWRFGSDQFDYYEYRAPLIRGWQNLHVTFADLTNLKASMTAKDYVSRLQAYGPVPGGTIQVIGQPTLTNAPYFVLGVQNHTGQPCLTTDIWWDELRLLSANDKPGIAWNGSTQLKLAEFGKISAGIVDESADFHRVDERFNTSRATTFNWNVTGEFAADKLLPKWMEDKGSKLPITISHAELMLNPEYIVNTDVSITSAIAGVNSNPSLTPAQKAAAIDSINTNNNTLQVKNSFGANDIALRFPGSFFLLPAFVNRLNFGFGYGEGFLRSPQYEYDRTWSWTASARYSLPPLPGLGIQPFSWLIGNKTILIGPYADWKINLLPSNVSFAIAATRARDNSLEQLSTLSLPPEGAPPADTQAVLNSRVPLINRIFTATRGVAITWKPFEGGILTPAFDYSLDVTSNLAGLETTPVYNQPTTYDSNGRPIYNYDSVYLYQRSTHDILNDIFFKNGAIARPGQDYSASQKVHMGTLPRLPGLFGIEKFIRPVFDYKVEYKWLDAQTNLQNEKQSAWNNVITTGIEFNVRDITNAIFGTPPEETSGKAPPGRLRGKGERGAPLGNAPELIPERGGGQEHESPGNPPREEPRNQIDRGEDMRPQMQPNPLGRTKYITDTMHTHPDISTPIDTVGKIHSPGIGTAGQNDREYVVDTILTPETPPSEMPAQPEYTEEKRPITATSLFQNLIQKPLMDWNGTRFNFVQTNSSLNNALAGDGSGITNFFSGGIINPALASDGPTRAYQLGLITDPAGRLLFHWHNTFPFLTYSVAHGLRQDDPFGGSTDVVDAFNETNNFELTTSRPLWAGASINLNWKLAFGFDEKDALHINRYGEDSLTYAAKSGDVSRTFLSIPSLPFINVLQSGILRVGQIYAQKVEALGYTVDNARDSLPAQVHNTIEQEAFMQGFETLPFFTSVLREYLPRLNYSFAWTGMEKFFLFSFADHVSFRDAYNGTYRRSFRQDPGDTVSLTSMQTIVYGFRPLIAFDMAWDKIWGGKLTTSVNYDTQTQWAADYASTRITRRLSTTFGITGNFSHEGLSIPFLKLNLKNKFGATFTLSQTISEDSYYNFWSIQASNPGGISDGGLTKTTIEPRVSYDVSSQLTADAFYHYERTTPAASGLISPPTRLIEAGFDIKLKIQ